MVMLVVRPTVMLKASAVFSSSEGTTKFSLVSFVMTPWADFTIRNRACVPALRGCGSDHRGMAVRRGKVDGGLRRVHCLPIAGVACVRKMYRDLANIS